MQKTARNAVRRLAFAMPLVIALSAIGFAQQTSSGGGSGGTRMQAPKDFPSDRIAGMVAEWTRAKAYTKEYLDAMPDDGYAFKPTPEIRTFAQQMGHLADANYAFISAATGKAKPMDASIEKMADQSKAAITKATMDSYDFIIAALKGMTDADLDKDVKVFNMNMKMGVAFEKAFEHQTHHRGQSTVYIRLKGAKPPQEKLF